MTTLEYLYEDKSLRTKPLHEGICVTYTKISELLGNIQYINEVFSMTSLENQYEERSLRTKSLYEGIGFIHTKTSDLSSNQLE